MPCAAAGPRVAAMASIDSITLEVGDPTAAQAFYSTAFGLGPELQLRAAEAPTSGFRGFTRSLTVAQPANVRALVDAALDAGATEIKPAAKSLPAPSHVSVWGDTQTVGQGASW